MNISRNWLKEFVDIEATDREYDEIMTIAGQKVETTTRMDAEIKNVVVGKVLPTTCGSAWSTSARSSPSRS